MTCWRQEDYEVTTRQRQSDVGSVYTSPPRENKQTKHTHTHLLTDPGSSAQMHLNSCVKTHGFRLYNSGSARWQYGFPGAQSWLKIQTTTNNKGVPRGF